MGFTSHQIASYISIILNIDQLGRSASTNVWDTMNVAVKHKAFSFEEAIDHHRNNDDIKLIMNKVI